MDPRSSFILGASALLLAASAATAGTISGRVVVGHDANTLSTSLVGATESQLAVNIAQWLTAAQPGEGNAGKSILLVQSSRFDTRHDIAHSIEHALMDAGFTVTSTFDHNQSFATLSQYNAVFTSFDFDLNYAFQNPTDLTTYVQQGGGVYMWAGMGPRTDIEVATLNPFLESVGLKFSEQIGTGLGGGNGIYGHTVQSSHPIFSGITGSWLRSQNGGTSIMTTGTHQNAQVIESVNGYGVYAVSEGVIPTPGTAVLALTGVMLVVPRRRR